MISFTLAVCVKRVSFGCDVRLINLINAKKFKCKFNLRDFAQLRVMDQAMWRIIIGN